LPPLVGMIVCYRQLVLVNGGCLLYALRHEAMVVLYASSYIAYSEHLHD
jgi:hypothetical protein